MEEQIFEDNDDEDGEGIDTLDYGGGNNSSSAAMNNFLSNGSIINDNLYQQRKATRMSLISKARGLQIKTTNTSLGGVEDYTTPIGGHYAI